MSTGYAPEDDELRPEGPAEPGSADAFIDATNAQPLAAPVSGVIPDDNAFVPPVPPEAPGMVPIPPALPGAGPAPIPLAGAPTPPIPAAAPPPGSIADVAQAGAKAAASTREAGKANLDALAAGQEHAPEVQALKQEQADNARLEQADIEAHLQASKDAEAKATEAWNQAAANKKNFKFRDFWENKSTARRIGSALAVAFGAYGASLNHTQNYALEILNKEMDDDHRNQVAQLGQLSDAELTAKTGIADARAARVQGLTDIGTRSAASDRAIAAKAAEVAQITADEQAKARLLAFGKDLEARADQTELTTKAGLYNSILKGETERAKNAETAAHTNLMNAQAGKIGRAAAGAGHANSNLSILSTAAEEGKTLKDITAMPEAKGVKFDIIKKIYDEGQKLAGDNNPDIVAADKRAKAVQEKELFGQRGPATQLERIEAMQTELRAAIKAGDKTAATRVLEEAGGMLSGGKSTKNTVELLHSLQSSSDELSEKWNKITGDPGASKAYTARLEKLLGGTAEEKRQEIDDIRSRYIAAEVGQHGMAKRPQTKDRVLGHAAALFGSVRNAGGEPRYQEGGGESKPPASAAVSKAPSGSKAGKLPDGRAAFKYPDGSVHLADGSLVD